MFNKILSTTSGWMDGWKQIHKIQRSVTICENFIFEISIFHQQNHFMTMAYD